MLVLLLQSTLKVHKNNTKSLTMKIIEILDQLKHNKLKKVLFLQLFNQMVRYHPCLIYHSLSIELSLFKNLIDYIFKKWH